LISWNDAFRDGTGRFRWSTCVGDLDDVKPAAPARMASRTIVAICWVSASVASRSDAASPMTKRRTAECPT